MSLGTPQALRSVAHRKTRDALVGPQSAGDASGQQSGVRARCAQDQLPPVDAAPNGGDESQALSPADAMANSQELLGVREMPLHPALA